jgi:hypothetical protein
MVPEILPKINLLSKEESNSMAKLCAEMAASFDSFGFLADRND